VRQQGLNPKHRFANTSLFIRFAQSRYFPRVNPRRDDMSPVVASCITRLIRLRSTLHPPPGSGSFAFRISRTIGFSRLFNHFGIEGTFLKLLTFRLKTRRINISVSTETNILVQRAATELKTAGAREIYVFGSAAHGTGDAASDLDLAVSGLPPSVFYRMGARVSDLIGRSVDLIDLDRSTPFTRYLRTENELVRAG
jgi:predicted nucleotidyltransferase